MIPFASELMHDYIICSHTTSHYLYSGTQRNSQQKGANVVIQDLV